MFKFDLLVLSCIGFIAISTALTCNDFKVQEGIDVLQGLGKWNIMKIGTIHSIPEFIKPLNDSEVSQCLKIHFMDHFAIEGNNNKFITYIDWPAIENFVPTIGRVNGIEIPDVDNAGRMLFTFPFFIVEHTEVLVLHTDYSNTALIMSCFMDEGGSFSGQFGMMSRDETISQEIVQEYFDIINPYQMEIAWIDIEHLNCSN